MTVEGMDRRMPSLTDDLTGHFLFSGTTQDKNAASAPVYQEPSQLHEIIHRPVLGRAESRSRIETNHFRVGKKSGLSPHGVGRPLVSKRSRQLHLIAGLR